MFGFKSKHPGIGEALVTLTVEEQGEHTAVPHQQLHLDYTHSLSNRELSSKPSAASRTKVTAISE